MRKSLMAMILAAFVASAATYVAAGQWTRAKTVGAVRQIPGVRVADIPVERSFSLVVPIASFTGPAPSLMPSAFNNQSVMAFEFPMPSNVGAVLTSISGFVHNGYLPSELVLYVNGEPRYIGPAYVQSSSGVAVGPYDLRTLFVPPGSTVRIEAFVANAITLQGSYLYDSEVTYP